VIWVIGNLPILAKKSVAFPRTKAAGIRFTPSVERDFVSSVEAESWTGVSRWTWRKMALQSRLDYVKVGKRMLLPVSEIQRVLAEGLRPRTKKS
jgi:hypothetical protein